MNKSTLLRVTKLQEESNDCLSLILAKPEGFTYQAGDCLYVSFPGAPLLGKQTYSFASSPVEDFLMLTYKKGYSEYKHYLEALHVGDDVQVTRIGSNFVFDPTRESVMIAGGVGITPLRSMIKTRLATYPTAKTVLIFLNSTSDFPFKKELKEWSEKFPTLEIYWQATDKEGRLTSEKLSVLLQGEASRYHYYLAGPPLMVDHTVDILDSLEIETDLVHTDSFDGYIEEV